MTLLLLALVGMAEAVVHQSRYRATFGTPLSVGVWTLLLCLLRVGFVALGVSVMLREQWALALFAYAVPAAVTTAVARGLELRKAVPA